MMDSCLSPHRRRKGLGEEGTYYLMRDSGSLAERPRDLLCCPLPRGNGTDDVGGEAFGNLQLFGGKKPAFSREAGDVQLIILR